MMRYVVAVLVLATSLLLAALFLLDGPAAADNDASQPLSGEPAAGEPITELKVIDIKVGDGEEAKDGYRIAVAYTGTYLDGRVFDSSAGKPPYSFRLGWKAVIPGWDKGILGMKVGGKRRLYVPYRIAYGEEGGNGIPPRTDLKFDVELLAVQR